MTFKFLSIIVLGVMAFVRHELLWAESCPERIFTVQSLKVNHRGWETGIDDTQSPLVSIRISDGDPKELAWLIPDKTLKGGTQEWVLPLSIRGYWIVCGYANTAVVLTKKIENKAKKCRVYFDRNFNPPIASKYVCE